MTLYRIDTWGTKEVDIDFDCDSPEQAAELFINQKWGGQFLEAGDYKLEIYSLKKDMDHFYKNGWKNDREHGWECFEKCGEYITTIFDKRTITVKKV
jgi:hypothetical protein